MPNPTQPHAPSIDDCIGMFNLSGEKNLVAQEHFGIANGRITTNVLYSNVLSGRMLFAPPYAGSNFELEGRLFGELVPTRTYHWSPIEVHRQGEIQGIMVGSSLTLIEGRRALALEITLKNTKEARVNVPLLFSITGGMDYVTAWEFHRPKADKPTWTSDKGNLLLRRNDTGGYAVGMSGVKMRWEDFCDHWTGSISLKPGEIRTVYLFAAMQEADDAERTVRELLKDPAGAIVKSRKAYRHRAADLLNRLPRFSAADARLEQFYYRAAIPLLLNRWEVPEFHLHPYYSTGSVNGGCIGAYLWDFGEPWEVWPLADPAALREHVKTFLAINLTKHFAFNPLGGTGWGPWYYINQEKIVFLIYYYVMLTGDEAFLRQRIAGKRILDWVVHHAMFGDEGKPKANLIDYGAGNHHLELRREYRYDHILPDMNMRRYAVYEAAGELCKLAGESPVDFRARAQKLKKLIHKTLWSARDKWWFFQRPGGKKELRWTMQMFKVIDSGVLGKQERSALLAHLNEREFLSDFGMHSMSKLDPAYDQVDIDNGGGGACGCFPLQIIEKLYKAGNPDKAEDILSRILWWGDRLPYWSDSLVANTMDYRRDTPLQNTLHAAAGVQMILFGLFGIAVTPEGRIRVNPAPPSFSPRLSLKGVKIRGIEFDVDVVDGSYAVTAAGKTIRSRVGKAIVLRGDK